MSTQTAHLDPIAQTRFESASRDTKQLFFDRLSFVLFIVLAALILTTFRSYGITWDEPENDHYGYLIVKYYLALLHGKYDSSAVNLPISIYGGLFNTLQTLAIAISPVGPYETRHLINALSGLLGIIGCWKVGRTLAGPAGGFWAALLITVTPRYYGAMFNNPKDIPSAVAYIWSVYYLVLALKHLPRLPKSLIVKLSLAIGCALGIRTGAFLLVFYLGLVWLGFGLYEIRREGWNGHTRSNLFAMLKSLVTIIGISWILMLLCWPWAQQRPFTRPFESARTFMHYPWNHRILDNGILIRSLDISRAYIVRWLFMTTPELTLALLAAALAMVGVALWKHQNWLKTDRTIGYGLVAFSILFPIGVALATRPILYDADRHFTYVVPPAVCLAGAVLGAAMHLRRGPMITIYAVAGACILYQGSVMFNLHPDEYVYFNSISGGLRGAYQKYDTDYWGNSYREAIRSLVNYLETSERKTGTEQYAVMTFSERMQSTYYFPKWMKYVNSPDKADFVISITRDRMDESVDGNTIFTISRLGVPLAIVKDRRLLKGVMPQGWYSHP